MFKSLRRSRQRNDPAADDDDEPMKGTSYKHGVTPGLNSGSGGRGGGARSGRPLPGYDDHQHKRSSSNPGQRTNKPALRNYSGNTRNKHSAIGGGGASVSWVSDTCSETDVTETWVSDCVSGPGSDEGSDQGSANSDNYSGSRNSEHTGDFSRESGEFSNSAGSISRDTTSSGYSEHEEGSSEEGDSYSEQKIGITDDDDASYPSVGDNVSVSVSKKKSDHKSKPPPPPKRRDVLGLGGMMNDSSMSLGESSARSARSADSRGGNKGNISRNSQGNKGNKNNNSRSSGRKVGPSPENKSLNSSTVAAIKSLGGSTAATNNILNAMNTHNNQHTQPNNNLGHEEQRMKPPTMKGMPTNPKTKKYDRRASSSSLGGNSMGGGAESVKSTPLMASSTPLASSGATAATSASDGVNTVIGGVKDKDGNTEVAAMQQLAYLVVSLRSDLREANLARDELESKAEELEKNGATPLKSKKATDNPYSNDSKVRQLEKENADLQADVDAFIAEQDDLKNEVKQLQEDKSSLNDIISRLKKDNASTSKSKSNEDFEARAQELTDENRKLEREIQLLVGEKSQLVSSGESRSCEMEQLHKSLKEGESRLDVQQRVMEGMQEKIDSLENEVDRLEKECKEGSLTVALLEDDLERKEGEMEACKAELQSENKKMTLLRQRLSQVEKQKGEMTERSVAIDGVMLGLKKKIEELLKERNASRQQMKDLKKDNDCMSDELKMNSSNAIAKGASEADTLLNLQEMIASLEETTNTLEEELDQKDAELKLDEARISQLESKLRVSQEMTKRASLSHSSSVASLSSQSIGGNGSEESLLKENIAALTSANESLQSKISMLEDEQALIEDELELYKTKVSILEDEQAVIEDELELHKNSSAETMKDLEVSIQATLVNSKSTLELQQLGSLSEMANLEKLIEELEETKGDLEDEMNEATDAIAMLEDELDSKDAQVKDLLVKLTMLQQQFSQVDKCKTALAERNARLSSDNDDLSTQIKVLIIEKKVASEEIETLKTMKSIADEDQEEDRLRKYETRQEVDILINKFEQSRAKSNEQIYNLEQNVFALEESKKRVEEDLDEGNDAIVMLREALKELEEGKTMKEAIIKECKIKMAEKEMSLESVDAMKEKFEREHEVSVDTISTLQKMITSLENSKDDLEEELDASSAALIELKEQLKSRNTLGEVTEVEDKLEKATEKNGSLTQRISELTEVNKKMKDQVKDLGESLAKVTMRHAALQGPSSSRALISYDVLSTDLLSNDPVASCDALISELKNQIKEIVSSRKAALEEIEFLRSDGASVISGASDVSREGVDSHSTNPSAKTMPPQAVGVGTSSKKESLPDTVSNAKSNKAASSSPSPLDESINSEDDSASTKTIEKSLHSPSIARTAHSRSAHSSSLSNAGSRGSSLLEAAKILCNQLDEKRSKEEMEKMSINNGNSTATSSAASLASKKSAPMKNVEPKAIVMQWEEEQGKNVLDIDDNISAREVKEDSPKETEQFEVKTKPPTEEEKKEDNAKSSRTKGRYDIDQLTSIYFEKCGMSISRFSDLSSDSSSFRRRTKASAPDATVTKKVKICRNGVFMGTYEGDLNPDGQRHGFGVLLCDNGNSYEGEWKKDKRDGLGIARYSSGDVYDGQWQRGKRQGHGVMYIEAGDTYIGSWDNGLKHGAGTYHWADGEVDVSWYQEDRRVGEGVRWNASRSKAYRLIRGTKKEELSLDEAYMTAEKLGLNLEKFDSGVP
mmetsp:Transcript_31967/g.57777  ORF Transcript_31967/g.57777 Transcript_31967/m.57777 type:complete len:1737 (-) Transcript_31967:83-5293(-)|eukprot:CAMPEP_0201945156 /NCGR_PEP_ID=MMETSP0903-20130614/53758_1 /ASSEMBLY_ACC=CAM_ASM_000552 /TAXON_ID=420261 /ORGANISM="Thalassiosira antarctica, Strain CCMP982" /LENGTH=1736 /DNA_ID=CAMNT_0048488215 /DNA_START=280 /DNA_END=5490 /DNA_ORIENTATION=-